MASSRTTAAPVGGRDGVEDSELTYNETIDAIVQFLEAAFHTILYIRGVYPPEIFKAHRLYSHPVYRSRHPGLNEYISTVLSSIRTELRASRVSQVFLVLKSTSTGAFLERYVFRLSYLLEGTHAVHRSDRDLSIRDNVTFRELSSIFRGFLMKLAVCEVGLEQVPEVEDVEFAVLVQAREGCRVGPQGEDPNQADEGMWVPADPQEGFFADQENTGARTGEGGEDEEMNSAAGGSELRARRQHGRAASQSGPDENEGTTILPIKSLDSGVINLMLYVEDNPTIKASLRRSNRSRHSVAGPTSTPKRQPRPDSQEQQQYQEQQQRRRQAFDPLELSGSRERDIEDLLGRDNSGAPPGGTRGAGKGRTYEDEDEDDDDDDDARGQGNLDESQGSRSRGTKRKGIVVQRRPSNSMGKGKGKGKSREGKGKGKKKRRGRDGHTTTTTAAGGPSLTLVHEDMSSEDLSDSSASSGTDDSDGREDGVEGEGEDSRSPSSDDRSGDDDDDGSIVSVGDFAGYGGTGAGMGAAW